MIFYITYIYLYIYKKYIFYITYDMSIFFDIIDNFVIIINLPNMCVFCLRCSRSTNRTMEIVDIVMAYFMFNRFILSTHDFTIAYHFAMPPNARYM